MHLSRRSVVYTSIQYIAVFFWHMAGAAHHAARKKCMYIFLFSFFHVFFGTWQARLITLREKVGNKFVHALRNVYLLSEDGTIPVDDVARNLYGNRFTIEAYLYGKRDPLFKLVLALTCIIFIWQKRPDTHMYHVCVCVYMICLL